MKRNKLVVLSVDALLWEDLYIARNYPGFSRIMKQHCGVEQVLSVYPTQTYPIHVVQATGQNMMDTGVYNNEAFQPGGWSPTGAGMSPTLKYLLSSMLQRRPV